jgi:mono/diheme cytochrome c family protein
VPLTADLLARGQQRYNIFCTPCHGLTGDGNGFVTTRGYRRPPTFHSDRLRAAPVGHYFDVITNGFGAMYDYSAQIPPRDRWAIIAYVRALQLSQNVPAAQLTPDQRAKLAAGGAAQ